MKLDGRGHIEVLGPDNFHIHEDVALLKQPRARPRRGLAEYWFPRSHERGTIEAIVTSRMTWAGVPVVKV